MQALAHDIQRLAQDNGHVTQGPEIVGPEGLDAPVLALDTEYEQATMTLTTVAMGTTTRVAVSDQDVDGSPVGVKAPDVQVLCGHNIPEDLALAWEHGVIPPREEWLLGKNVLDTYLIARMVNEERPSFRLEDLVAEHLVLGGSWKQQTDDRDFGSWSGQERRARCAHDAWGAAVLAECEWPLLSESSRALYEFTVRTAMVLHRLTLAGAFVDLIMLETLHTDLSSAMERAGLELTHQARALGCLEFEPTNRQHVGEVLYKHLELPVLDWTPKRGDPAVTRSVVTRLLGRSTGQAKEFLRTWLEYAKAEKLCGTYLIPLSRLVKPIGVIGETRVGYLPFRFHTLGARTGRRSSSKPNAQNWSPEIRSIVTSRWEGGWVASIDYQKLEPVILAWLAKDERLLELFTVGGGYGAIAEDLLGHKVEEGTEDYALVKRLVLGVHYNMTPDEMARQMWLDNQVLSVDYETHEQSVAQLHRKYLALFPRVQEYMARREQEVATRGVVRTPTGRVRRVGQSSGKRERNQAINAPVQSTASDVMASALCDVEAAIRREVGVTLGDWYDILLEHRRKFLTASSPQSRVQVNYRWPVIFGEVHDELLVDLPPGPPERWLELITAQMTAVPTLRELCPYLRRLPLRVKVKYGRYWGG